MLGGSEESIKFIVVGDGNVGKTCMLRRFVRGDFIEQYKKTIGAEFMEKDVFLRSSNTTVKLMLWDTAGQEVFNALTQAYYRGAGAAIVAFSTVDRDSFMNVRNWKQRVESVCGPVVMVLCQTKFDLSHEAAITNEEAEALAVELKIPFFRVSTKDDFNVTQLFEFAAQQCMEAAGGSSTNGEATRTPAIAKEETTTSGAPAAPSGTLDASPPPIVPVPALGVPSATAAARSSGAAESPSIAPATGAAAQDLKTKSQKPSVVRLNETPTHKKKKKMKCMLL